MNMSITPGDAAVMNTSVASPAAARRLAMSASASAVSRYATGPLQLGLPKTAARSGSLTILWANSGKASRSRIWKGAGSPPKPDSRSVT
jgi:hypothetical protein